MKKLIVLLLFVTGCYSQCPPPKHCIQICNELETTIKYWNNLTAKDKILVKTITLNKYGKIDSICLRNKSAREFLIKLQTD
jgi:glutamate synthase domain-containing protein 2